MMVLFQIAVEARDGGKMIRSPRQPQVGESFQRAIYGGAGDSRDTSFYVGINLVDGGMIVAFEQRREDRQALNRYRNAALPAGGVEPQESGGADLCGRFQGSFLS